MDTTGDLLGDETRLPHARDEHPSLASLDGVDSPDEFGPEVLSGLLQAPDFLVENPAGARDLVGVEAPDVF